MEKSGFFNSSDGDRIYDATDFAAYFGSLVSNGVFYTAATNLQATPGNGLAVSVAAGSAWINGYRYLIQNHHEPIISREDFEAAQAVIAQRAREKGIEKRDGKNQNSYPFSGKIICGNCGGTFKRRIHASGKHRIAWCCTTHLADIAECPVKYIPDSALEVAFVTMMNKLIFGHQTVLRPLLVSLRGITSDSSLKSIGELDKKLEDNTEQRKVLVGLLTKGYAGGIRLQPNRNGGA